MKENFKKNRQKRKQERFGRKLNFKFGLWWTTDSDSIWINCVALKRAIVNIWSFEDLYLAGFCVFLGNNTAWMFGKTPPCAMVTPDRSFYNSSSVLMASCRWRGIILLFLLSRASLPANSRTSAANYKVCWDRWYCVGDRGVQSLVFWDV